MIAERLLRAAARTERAAVALFRDRPHHVLLTLVLLAAAVARFGAAGDGLPYLHTWDEPYTVWRAETVLLTGDLNHRSFHYGSLLVYMNVILFVVHTWWLLSRPASVPDHLTSLDELVHGTDLWMWTTSHPSYYLWARCLVGLQGVATVALVYWMAKAAGGRWAGLAAAALLAAAPAHVAYSALVVNEVPGTFLIAAITALCLRFVRDGAPYLLLWACLLVGFTASTKYNMGVVWVVPVVALAQVGLGGRPGYRHDLWVAVAAIPILGFLLTTPFAIVDLRTFMDQSGTEVRHYLVYGHGGQGTTAAGTSQLVRQLTEIGRNTGFVPLLLAPLALLALRREHAPVLLAFPLVYGALMSSALVNFHRNWIPIYPAVALLFGVGLAWLHGRIADAVARRGSRRWDRAGVVVVAALLTGALAWQVGVGVAKWRHRESRTVAVDVVDRLAAEQGWVQVGIADELKIHPFDLARLRVPYVVLPLDELVCSAKPTVIVLGTDHVAHRSSHLKKTGYFQRIGNDLDTLELGTQLAVVAGGAANWGSPSIEPGVRVVSRVGVPTETCAEWARLRALLETPAPEPVPATPSP